MENNNVNMGILCRVYAYYILPNPGQIKLFYISIISFVQCMIFMSLNVNTSFFFSGGLKSAELSLSAKILKHYLQNPVLLKIYEQLGVFEYCTWSEWDSLLQETSRLRTYM